MPVEHTHDTRPGIDPGQLLPLSEFVFRARISRSIWLIMLSQATKHGYKISLRIGKKTYVNTSKFADFLEMADSKKLKLTGGGL